MEVGEVCCPPFSHLCPVRPGGQRQRPVDASHGASPAQSHDCPQLSPNLPASHPENKTRTKDARVASTSTSFVNYITSFQIYSSLRGKNAT